MTPITQGQSVDYMINKKHLLSAVRSAPQKTVLLPEGRIEMLCLQWARFIPTTLHDDRCCLLMQMQHTHMVLHFRNMKHRESPVCLWGREKSKYIVENKRKPDEERWMRLWPLPDLSMYASIYLLAGGCQFHQMQYELSLTNWTIRSSSISVSSAKLRNKTDRKPQTTMLIKTVCITDL